MVADALHVFQHALLVILEGQPVDVLAIGGARILTVVVPTVGVDAGGVQAAAQQIAHDVVVEQLHAAIGMVNDKEFLGAEQLVGNDQRADGVVAGAAAGIAGDMRVTLGQAGILGRVQARVHAGQDGEAARRGQRQVALGETRDIAFVGLQHFGQYFAH